MIERRIKAAKFPAVKSLDSFDVKAIPALNKMQVLELARCEWVERRENVLMPEACLQHDALGSSGTGKTHIASRMIARLVLKHQRRLRGVVWEKQRGYSPASSIWL